MSLSDEIKTDAGLAIHQWAAAFNEGDCLRAAALYDPEAVLWGTVWPTMLATQAGIRQYFERAFSMRPQPTVVLGERRLRVYGDTAIHSGEYTFILLAGAERQIQPARFSFTYRNRSGRWLIVDHHSSAVPATA